MPGLTGSLLSFVCLLAGVAIGQTTPPPVALEIRGAEDVRSSVFQIGEGEQISVWLKEPGRVLAFVYRENGTLVARSQAGPNQARLRPGEIFRWSAVEAGRYYVLLQGLDEGAQTAEIRLEPPDPDGARPAKTEPNYLVRRIYFATNRTIDQKAGVYFGPIPDEEDRLTYGQLDVSIPRDHRMGELEGPMLLTFQLREEDPNKDVVVLPRSVKSMSSDQSRNQLRVEVANTQRREAMVFIHGFNNTFVAAARRLGQIAYDLGFPGPAVLYSWPSKGAWDPIAYNTDGVNAERSSFALQKMLEEIRNTTGAKTIHLVAHSMGNRVLTGALDKMSRSGTWGPEFRRVVLLAPDLDAGTFRQLAKQFPQNPKRVTVYISREDDALKMSTFLASGQGRAGRIPMTVAGVDTIDATTVDTSRWGFRHQYYGDSKTVLYDLFFLLRGVEAEQRRSLQRVNPEGYYRLVE